MSKGSKRITKVSNRPHQVVSSSITLVQEFAELSKNPPQDMEVNLGSENDFYKWVVTMAGPEDSPYAV